MRGTRTYGWSNCRASPYHRGMTAASSSTRISIGLLVELQALLAVHQGRRLLGEPVEFRLVPADGVHAFPAVEQHTQHVVRIGVVRRPPAHRERRRLAIAPTQEFPPRHADRPDACSEQTLPSLGEIRRHRVLPWITGVHQLKFGEATAFREAGLGQQPSSARRIIWKAEACSVAGHPGWEEAPGRGLTNIDSGQQSLAVDTVAEGAPDKDGIEGRSTTIEGQIHRRKRAHACGAAADNVTARSQCWPVSTGAG